MEKLKITLATGNPHKVEEINLIAKEYNIEFVLPKGDFDPIEDGKTFLENAYCKAKCASKLGGTKYFLADDSGLCIEALNGAPGIYSARYETTPKKRIEKVLKNLEGIEKEEDRKAYFACAMVVVDLEGKILFQVEKRCYGFILKEPVGENGFGYDPIFYVEEAKKGMATLKKEEKATLSHRAKALKEVLNWLQNERK